MFKRIAFRLKLKAGFAEEYKKRHDEIFPELVDALKKVGVRDYSIWHDQETDHLFAILSLTEDHMIEKLHDFEIVKNWWMHMADVMEVNLDKSPVKVELRQVFQLQ